ncbi:MAG: hypothetical protein L3J67_06275 [Hyphomicrobiaceae bacterium]|nr:hypothetical protein [Hyphomicrobiaceae bacterium]
MKNNDLFNMLLPLDRVHNGIFPIFREYAALRMSISRKLPSQIQGTIARSDLDEDTKSKLDPIIADMNSLLFHGHETCTRTFKEADEVMALLPRELEKNFGTKMSWEPYKNQEKI